MSNKKFDISKFADKALRKKIVSAVANCPWLLMVSPHTSGHTNLLYPVLNTCHTWIKTTKKNVALIAWAIRDARNVRGTNVGINMYFDEFATLSKKDLKNMRVSSPSRPK